MSQKRKLIKEHRREMRRQRHILKAKLKNQHDLVKEIDAPRFPVS